jgi:hypothetical protein
LAPGQTSRQRLGTRARGRARRRLRYLRRLRELQLRDLGGLVLDLYRFGERRDGLVREKLEAVMATDREVRELQDLLGDRNRTREVRQPGVGGACANCGALHSSDARFCARCGAELMEEGIARGADTAVEETALEAEPAADEAGRGVEPATEETARVPEPAGDARVPEPAGDARVPEPAGDARPPAPAASR